MSEYSNCPICEEQLAKGDIVVLYGEMTKPDEMNYYRKDGGFAHLECLQS